MISFKIHFLFKTLVQIHINVNFDSFRISFLQYMFSVDLSSEVKGDPGKHQASCDDIQYTTVALYKENKNAAVFKNVKVYAGDPWHPPANGYMLCFKYF